MLAHGQLGCAGFPSQVSQTQLVPSRVRVGSILGKKLACRLVHGAPLSWLLNFCLRENLFVKAPEAVISQEY